LFYSFGKWGKQEEISPILHPKCTHFTQQKYPRRPLRLLSDFR